jgi:hypothetical protein
MIDKEYAKVIDNFESALTAVVEAGLLKPAYLDRTLAACKSIRLQAVRKSSISRLEQLSKTRQPDSEQSE